MPKYLRDARAIGCVKTHRLNAREPPSAATTCSFREFQPPGGVRRESGRARQRHGQAPWFSAALLQSSISNLEAANSAACEFSHAYHQCDGPDFDAAKRRWGV